MATLADAIQGGSIQHVVILMQENRSFDEYFGTFPGANGFANLSQSQAAAAWTGSPSVLPFRLSTFTWPVDTLGCDHSWAGQHTSWHNGALDGWYPGNTAQCLGYFLQDDVPYHWWLAQNFVLCDNYHCSVLGPTIPNRLYMMTGTAIDPTIDPTSASWPTGDTYPLFGVATPPNRTNGPSTGSTWIEPTWNTYADCLTDANKSWKVYDLATDGQPGDLASASVLWDLNALTWFQKTWNTLFPLGSFPTPTAANPQVNLSHYASGINGGGLKQFTDDINSNSLPLVSWIIPPYGFTEHPENNQWDGAALVSNVVAALLSKSEIWSSTVLILTYDENDGHYDHVLPFVPGLPTTTQPTVNASEYTFSSQFGSTWQPTGSGFRVPTTVISPWTFQAPQGICSTCFDHTSIIKFLEEVTLVPCSTTKAGQTFDNLSAWRRDNNNFASLSAIPINSQPVTAGDIQNTFPLPPNAGTTQGSPLPGTVQAYATTRQNLLTGETPIIPVVAQQTWPPVPQSCQLIMTTPSYGEAPVLAQPGGTFSGSVVVVINGFEPDELFDANATGPILSIAADSPNNLSPCNTRVPTIKFFNSNGQQVTNITCVASRIDYDPSQVQQPNGDPWLSGFPYPFTFYCDLTFEDPTATFNFLAGTTNTLMVVASFQVDATVTSVAELELVTTDDPQFFHSFTNNTTYLSGELRVFSIPAGESLFGVTLGLAAHPMDATAQDALNFITGVIGALNGAQIHGATPLPTTQFPAGSGNLVSSFDDLEQGEETNPLSLFATQQGSTPIFNFALARVHMQANVNAPNVRVFFRSFRASVTASAYDPVTNFTDLSAYRSNPPTGPGTGPNDVKVPLLGVLPVVISPGQTDNECVTIPFFATPRIVLDVTNPAITMRDQQPDTPNVQTIAGNTTDTPTQTFFGCWLDINQPEALFPIKFPNATNNWDGPWPASETSSILQAFVSDLHQCLVAEISFDPITIPSGDSPAVSAWLAQRNLGFTTS